jgi:hypothetical protein
MSNALHVPFDAATARTAEGARSPTYPRLVIATTILASSLAFIDGSVVNVGLPAIGRSFDPPAVRRSRRVIRTGALCVDSSGRVHRDAGRRRAPTPAVGNRRGIACRRCSGGQGGSTMVVDHRTGHRRGRLSPTLRIGSATSYWLAVFRATAVIALGIAGAVAPLTTAVLMSVHGSHTGAASGPNSAVARTGGLVAISLIGPVIASSGSALLSAFGVAAAMGAVICLVGAASAAMSIAPAGKPRS